MILTLIRKQIVFLLLFATAVIAGAPDWNVNPSQYLYSSTVTGALIVNDTLTGEGNIIGAFVGNEVRGVASPIQVGSSWLYFLTVFSNTGSGETVTFKSYLANADMIVSVDETLPFVANSINGAPGNPFQFHVFVNYDHAPVLAGIPDQTVETGTSFLPISLGSYLTNIDGDSILWSVQGNNSISIALDGNGTATFSYATGFAGTETVIFKATDNTVRGHSDSDTAVFTVLQKDFPPHLADIPNQTIGLGGSFPVFSLLPYLTLNDADAVRWKYVPRPVFVGAPAPVWSVSPTSFQFSMNVTAKVLSRGATVQSGNHIIGAFAGNELRGVTQGVPVADDMLFFLTVYANNSSEEITYRFYDGATEEFLPVAERTTFQANSIQGTPAFPVELHAANLLISIDNNNNVHTSIIDTLWTGGETVTFIAGDVGSIHSYADSDDVVFSVFPDHNPVVSGIADQTIEQGNSFATFDLDNYLIERDGDVITWSVSGNSNLQVSINAQQVVTVTASSPSWHGSETLVFTATDNTLNDFFDSDTAVFTIEPLDHRPDISNIPNQTIGLKGTFNRFDLDFYLTELDGDSIGWSYAYVSNPRGNASPSWSVVPSEFQFSMNVTASVLSRNVAVTNNTYKLGAFSGNELRGVAQPVQAGDSWLFFITVYANTSGEDISFRFFDSQLQDVIPVKEHLTFTPNSIIGTPANPYFMKAGNIIISIANDNTVAFDIVDTAWVGNEIAYFTARDVNRTHHYSDIDQAIFTIVNEHPPILEGIPDQTIEQGSSFAVIDLESYVQEVDGHSLIWSTSFSPDYTISINAANEAIVTPRSPSWIGSGDIVFQAKDATTTGLYDLDTARFTVIPVDHRPQISDALSQEIPPYGAFATFDLDNFVTNPDSDSLVWSYAFLPPPTLQTTPPVWSINPSAYQYSMTVTGVVTSLSKIPANGNCMLAAYSGTELRGVTSPVQVGDTWMYFITMYSNGDGETLKFQFYDATTQRLLPIKETVQFVPNAVLGGPLAPLSLNAGNLLVTMGSGNTVSIERTLQSWLGTERLVFIAKDVHTLNEYADTSDAQFTVIQDAFGNAQETITLGDIPVHVSKVETVTVTNTGTGNLNISSVGINNADYSVTPASAVLAENETQKFIVTFTPSSSGDKNAVLTFVHNAYRSPRNIVLEGSGQYLVITAVADGNGTLTPAGAKNISYGTNQAYDVLPDRGHKIDSVIVDGVNLGVLTNYDFLNVIVHHSITAYFSIIPSYGVTYRTATMEDWATALDKRGKRRQMNRKYDKIMFSFDLTADATRQLRLAFNMDAEGVITKGTATLDTIATFSGKTYSVALTSAIASGQTIHVTGVGNAGRYITTRYAWGTSPLKALQRKDYKRIQLGVPLPNLINVGKEMFGVGQRGAFPNGLRLGIAQGVRGGGSVVHYKYVDVLTSLAKETITGGFLLHTQGPKCLDTLNGGKPMSFRERNLSIDKQNNKLFAEALALRLNITASMLGKFPVGLGELRYTNTADSADPFNGMLIKQISSLTDTVLSCQPTSQSMPFTFSELYTAIRSINGSFRTTGVLDTISFMKSTRLTGTKRLLDVDFLTTASGVVAQTLDIEEDLSNDDNDLPEQFSLYQNYPNPFNPSTIIGYKVIAQSMVTLKVYDMLGREVATLLDKAETEPGEYDLEFNAAGLASGVYYYRIISQNADASGNNTTLTEIKRMMLLK